MSALIIGITGKARSGKSTVGEILRVEYGFEVVNFADTLKKVAYDTDPVVGAKVKYSNAFATTQTQVIELVHLQELIDDIGEERAKSEYPEVRRFYQRLGNEGVKGNMGQQVWLDVWHQKMASNSLVVAADVRFTNEAELITRLGGEVWKVKRPSLAESADTHLSETELDQIYPDETIINDGSLDSLREKIKKLLEKS